MKVRQAVGFVTLAGLEAAIRSSWGPDTSDDPQDWSDENPARGQCAVTAMVVRELLGGEILIAPVLPRAGIGHEHHAWNRLPSGLEVDLTREQFTDGEDLGPPEVREPRVAIRGVDRYRLFAERVEALLGAHQAG